MRPSSPRYSVRRGRGSSRTWNNDTGCRGRGTKSETKRLRSPPDAASKPPSYHLHVLLRHRLLRQPHGCERLFARFVQAVTNHLRITEVVRRQRTSRSVLTPLPRPLPALAEHIHDRITRIYVLAPLNPVVLPSSEPLAEEPLDSPGGRGRCLPRACCSRTYPRQHLDRNTHASSSRSPALEHARERFDDLHVLLRHRLLRQPHRFQGLGSIAVLPGRRPLFHLQSSKSWQ